MKMQGWLKIRKLSENPRRRELSTPSPKYSTRGYRGLQGVTGDYKGLQGVTGGNKGLQGVTKGYKGLKGVTGVDKGL